MLFKCEKKFVEQNACILYRFLEHCVNITSSNLIYFTRLNHLGVDRMITVHSIWSCIKALVLMKYFQKNDIKVGLKTKYDIILCYLFILF